MKIYSMREFRSHIASIFIEQKPIMIGSDWRRRAIVIPLDGWYWNEDRKRQAIKKLIDTVKQLKAEI